MQTMQYKRNVVTVWETNTSVTCGVREMRCVRTLSKYWNSLNPLLWLHQSI